MLSPNKATFLEKALRVGVEIKVDLYDCASNRAQAALA